jgi:hypothetical protein
MYRPSTTVPGGVEDSSVGYRRLTVQAEVSEGSLSNSEVIPVRQRPSGSDYFSPPTNASISRRTSASFERKT